MKNGDDEVIIKRWRNFPLKFASFLLSLLFIPYHRRIHNHHLSSVKQRLLHRNRPLHDPPLRKYMTGGRSQFIFSEGESKEIKTNIFVVLSFLSVTCCCRGKVKVCNWKSFFYELNLLQRLRLVISSDRYYLSDLPPKQLKLLHLMISYNLHSGFCV